MGQTTPNIGIYIPAAGETNYDSSFSAGMVNVDQHDHSGGPNKGVPISGSGIADGSITFEKLAADVVDSTTGIDTDVGANANKLIIIGLLKNIFQIATAAGFISKDGSNANARTLTSGNVNRITISAGDGVAGNPTFNIPNIPDFTGVNNGSGPLQLQSLGVDVAQLDTEFLDLSNGGVGTPSKINSFNTSFTNGGSGATTNVVTLGSSQTWIFTFSVDPNQSDANYSAVLLVQTQSGATMTINEVSNIGTNFTFTSVGLTLVLAIPAAVSRNIVVSGIRVL